MPRANATTASVHRDEEPRAFRPHPPSTLLTSTSPSTPHTSPSMSSKPRSGSAASPSLAPKPPSNPYECRARRRRLRLTCSVGVLRDCIAIRRATDSRLSGSVAIPRVTLARSIASAASRPVTVEGDRSRGGRGRRACGEYTRNRDAAGETTRQLRAGWRCSQHAPTLGVNERRRRRARHSYGLDGGFGASDGDAAEPDRGLDDMDGDVCGVDGDISKVDGGVVGKREAGHHGGRRLCRVCSRHCTDARGLDR